MSSFFEDVLPFCVIISILIVWFGGPLLFPEPEIESDVYFNPNIDDSGLALIPLIGLSVGIMTFGLAGFLTLVRGLYLHSQASGGSKS